jgi:serine/threonine-protein kinase
MAEITHIICPNPECQREIPPTAKFCPYCRHDVILNNHMPSDDRRYRITRIIKQGGQGAVYEGVDQDGRVYAIKEMLDYFIDPQERQEAINRFNAEANLLQKLSHPRIPRVHSHFTDEGRHYLTMDFVRGEDLEEIIQRQGALPEAQVLEWADQICDVLSYLHTKGMVYRDMKPSNVMIDAADGKVKLVDFGIAKILKPSEKGGTQIGTPGYAPPEQYQGRATPASDIYALGATLHHALTGRDPTEQPPFSFQPARNVNVQVSRRTSDALEQALNMRPDERFGSVAEFRAMLRPLPGAPAQVRVASGRTIALPGAARAQAPASAPAVSGSSAGQPAGSGSGAPQRANPLVPAAPQPVSPAPPPPAPAAKVPRTQPVPAPPAPPAPPAARRQRRNRPGGCILWAILALVGVALVVSMLSLGGIGQYLPDLPLGEPDTPEVELGPQRAFSQELTVTVPAGADDATIRTAFGQAYEARLAQEHPGAVINQNVGLTYVGDPPQAIGQENGAVQYQATVQGFVQLPQGP